MRPFVTKPVVARLLVKALTDTGKRFMHYECTERTLQEVRIAAYAAADDVALQHGVDRAACALAMAALLEVCTVNGTPVGQ